MTEMLCLKYQKIDIINIGREIKNDCDTATMCINMLSFFRNHIFTLKGYKIQHKTSLKSLFITHFKN